MLLGSEGAAARAYFECLGHLLPPGVSFPGRSGRHADDPVNASLNLGYALLLGETTGAVAAAGLDPRLGALHPPFRARPGLGLDLMEELRPVIVDAMVLAMWRRHSLTPDHFDQHRTTDGRDVTRFTDDGRRVLLRGYERRLRTSWAGDPRSVGTYRQIIRRQAMHLRRAIIDGEPYVPLAWR